MNVTVLEPHGFCSGVTGALRKALRLSAASGVRPLYCLHELVHNALVVSGLKDRGFAFVDDVDEVPCGATLLFSAHGVSPSVRKRAQEKRLDIVDATCPFVAKVHDAVRNFADGGLDVVVVGHPNHAEVKGLVGEGPADKIHVVSSGTLDALVEELAAKGVKEIAAVSQTTMDSDEVADVVSRLKGRFYVRTSAEVCRATKERQDAVKAFDGDALLVLGSAESSNTARLCEAAKTRTFRAGTMDEVRAIDYSGISNLGVTSGASTPEEFLIEAVEYLRSLK